jgi:GT2 family glycosyltransferase
LAAADYPDFSVVICENGGPDAFEELQRVVPTQLAGGRPVRAVLAPGNLGFAGGVNRCMAEAREADAWWILNPDTAPDPSALSRLVARLRRGDCQAVGGVLKLPDATVQCYGGRWRRWAARAVSLGHGAPVGAPVEAASIEARQNYLTGASALVGRAFLDRVGPMREDYFLYCEEVEWFLRAARLGMKLGFAPDAAVLHFQGTSTGNSLSLRDQSKLAVYLNERNRILLTRDRYPSVLPVASLAALGILALRYARRGAWRQLRYAAEGWWAGVRNERGVPAGLAPGR